MKISKPDVVIHLASFPREAAVSANPVEAARTMCQGHCKQSCIFVNDTVQIVLFISAQAMVYGDFETAREDDELNPSGQYSIWKIAGEELVKRIQVAPLGKITLSYVQLRYTAQWM